jgi:hypothetical protein
VCPASAGAPVISGGWFQERFMPAFVVHVLKFPLFPFVILGLIALLYWRGVMTMRNQAKKPKAGNKTPSS